MLDCARLSSSSKGMSSDCRCCERGQAVGQHPSHAMDVAHIGGGFCYRIHAKMHQL